MATKTKKKPVSKKKAAVKKGTAAKKKTSKKIAVKKTTRAKKKSATRGLPEKMRDAALKVLDARQAEDIVTVDLRGKSILADFAIIASGRSSRQLAAIADYLGAAFTELGARKIRIEGLPQGDWVLIDAGDVLVHLFRPEVRRYYNIEAIWSHHPRGA